MFAGIAQPVKCKGHHTWCDVWCRLCRKSCASSETRLHGAHTTTVAGGWKSFVSGSRTPCSGTPPGPPSCIRRRQEGQQKRQAWAAAGAEAGARWVQQQQSNRAALVPCSPRRTAPHRTHLAPLAVVHAPHEDRQLAVGHHVKVAHLISRGVARMHGVGLQGTGQGGWVGGSEPRGDRVNRGGHRQNGSALAGSAAAASALGRAVGTLTAAATLTAGAMSTHQICAVEVAGHAQLITRQEGGLRLHRVETLQQRGRSRRQRTGAGAGQDVKLRVVAGGGEGVSWCVQGPGSKRSSSTAAQRQTAAAGLAA